MPLRGPFEKRLLLALALFSLVPSLLLVGGGTYLLSESLGMQTSAAAWNGVAESGRELLEHASRSDDPQLRAAADLHRSELSVALLHTARWEYLNQRALRLVPVFALLLVVFLGWLAIRAARGIAGELVRPIVELVGWSALIARQEPLPRPMAVEDERPGEFEVLRRAFRTMEAELNASRARALEMERTRTWVSIARSIAHELKNSLTPLRLGVAVVERHIPASSPGREALEVVAAEASRLEDLARGFSQLGRLPESAPSEIDLCEQLDYLLRTHLPPSVSYRLLAPADLPPVHGHHDALSRAFANLLLNSVEAMGPEGGSIVVEAAASGSAVEVRIRDSGPGLPRENLEKLWDPDFTTKLRGTGLGLALVQQTVRAHGGEVSARNHPGGGAEFGVKLPLRPAGAPLDAERPVSALS